MGIISGARQLALLGIALFACASFASQRIALPFDGQQRTYAAHLPSVPAQSKGWPLVVVARLDATQPVNGLVYDASLVTKAEEMGFVLVAPELRAKTGKVDGAFIDAVVEDAARRFKIDPAAVYLAGITDGGAVVRRVAIGNDEVPRPVAWVSENLRSGDAPPRRAQTLTWCLDPKARRLLSMTEWFCGR